MTDPRREVSLREHLPNQILPPKELAKQFLLLVGVYVVGTEFRLRELHLSHAGSVSPPGE